MNPDNENVQELKGKIKSVRVDIIAMEQRLAKLEDDLNTASHQSSELVAELKDIYATWWGEYAVVVNELSRQGFTLKINDIVRIREIYIFRDLEDYTLGISINRHTNKYINLDDIPSDYLKPIAASEAEKIIRAKRIEYYQKMLSDLMAEEEKEIEEK